MIIISLNTIAQITQSSIIGNFELLISQFSFDSRSYVDSSKSCAIAFSGKLKNGHSYIPAFYEKGCRVFWVQKGVDYKKFPDATYIVSDNVLESFQVFAEWYRTNYTIPVIGITGSNGKTIVKEWLFHILKNQYSIVRSPRSYNSQIGVPLSVLQLDSNYNLGIFEAGISLPNEMENLEKIIKPSMGIFTNIADAHQENFKSVAEKVAEKMKLFVGVSKLVYCSDYSEIHTQAQLLSDVDLWSWGYNQNSKIQVSSKSIGNNQTELSILINGIIKTIIIPYSDKASIENALHCMVTLVAMNLELDNFLQFNDLPSVAMRLEQKTGRHNCTIINDSYNADLQSVLVALQFLSNQKQHSTHTIIISDIKQTGIQLSALYETISKHIKAFNISKVICVGNEIEVNLKPLISNGLYYNSTADLLVDLKNLNFVDEAILLKGAREFEFEKIAKKLEFQTHQTVLEINLNAIVHNLQYFKSYLERQTKVMVMVKAFSYGSGSFEIANILQHHHVDYLAVAFVDEGIELRNAGITLPIVVMNPEIGMLPQLFEYNLEPNIHNFSILQELYDVCKTENQDTYKIHIKIDTGMARYGFAENDIDQVIDILLQVPNVTIESVFSHLVGSDEDRFDEFTYTQIDLFSKIYSKIQSKYPYQILRHILNSAGIERFTEAQFDMVRLGIGLYGISAKHIDNCMHISTLKTFVSDIREMQSGSSVGYCRNGKILQPSKIAVLPIGYADGLRRKLSNGVGTVIINNNEVPIIGNICMDATMIDITGIDVEIGDEVVIFGKDLPISLMAKKLETIPYEIITSISRRVKRIYHYE